MYSHSVHCQTIPEHADAFAAQLALASTVYAKEPGTLAWIVQRSTEDACSFLISEIYASEQDHAVHQTNPFFAKFMATCKPWLAAYKVETYTGIEGAVNPSRAA
ncbi:hypothetical protein BDZ88DRAFT_455687 [Geranomyces variabilis]|nr:hypothetical protein BDZ88DRAFT_455687 [Geranomyces variabilis]KAJ3138245.1 hypothetical protein HDU90_001207 [Geranomyces variabilis]